MKHIKPIEELTFVDDYMFGFIMQNEKICRELLGLTTLQKLRVVIPCFVNQAATRLVRFSMPVSNNPWKNAPITLKVRKKTSAIMKMKAGMAVYFPVRILSIFWLRECSLLSLGFTTVWVDDPPKIAGRYTCTLL